MAQLMTECRFTVEKTHSDMRGEAKKGRGAGDGLNEDFSCMCGSGKVLSCMFRRGGTDACMGDRR